MIRSIGRLGSRPSEVRRLAAESVKKFQYLKNASIPKIADEADPEPTAPPCPVRHGPKSLGHSPVDNRGEHDQGEEPDVPPAIEDV